MAAAHGVADEGALADAGFDQPPPLRLDIAAGDGGEVDAENGGQGALRRQTVGRRQPASLDVSGDGIRYCQVARRAASGEVGNPFGQRVIPSIGTMQAD